MGRRRLSHHHPLPNCCPRTAPRCNDPPDRLTRSFCCSPPSHAHAPSTKYVNQQVRGRSTGGRCAWKEGLYSNQTSRWRFKRSINSVNLGTIDSSVIVTFYIIIIDCKCTDSSNLTYITIINLLMINVFNLLIVLLQLSCLTYICVNDCASKNRSWRWIMIKINTYLSRTISRVTLVIELLNNSYTLLFLFCSHLSCRWLYIKEKELIKNDEQN